MCLFILQYQSFDNSAAAGTKFTVKTFEQYYRNLTTTTKGLEASGLDEQFQVKCVILVSFLHHLF